MAHAEGWLAQRGVPKAMLMIRETNKKVIGFYERLGYAVEQRVVMARRLKKPHH
jgi:ribosomal protein S18 acetylase RimI-like enzyme